jgi:hypothetical protein
MPYTILELETEIKTLETPFQSKKVNIAPYSYEEKKLHFVMN